MDHKIRNGVLAYYNSWKDPIFDWYYADFGMLLYDPRDGAWHHHQEKDVSVKGEVVNFWIQEDGTACFEDNDGKTHAWGYDTWSSRTWWNGPMPWGFRGHTDPLIW